MWIVTVMAIVLLALAGGSQLAHAAAVDKDMPRPVSAAHPAAQNGVKVLRIGSGTYPDVLDPQKSSFVYEINILQLAYEGLLSIDSKGNVGPGSADKWEISADGKTMTFHIRDGLKRSDGTPLTAHDFDYALHREVDPRVLGRQYSAIVADIQGAAELDAIDANTASADEIQKALQAYGVQAADDSTLIVAFARPVGFWHYVATTWVTYPTDKRQVDKDPDNWWSKPGGHVGNGPFNIQTIDQNNKIVLVANPNYWRGKPKLDRIEFIYNTDNALILEAYRKGELDINAYLAPELLNAVAQDANLNGDFVRYPQASTLAIAFNNTRRPFDDKFVRTAFSQAFDREAWVRDVFNNVGKPYTRWIPPGVPGAQPDKPGVPVSDPKGAVQTLVNSGFGTSDSTAANPKVDCAQLGELKVTYPATPLNTARFQFLAGNFTRVFGCPVTLDPVDPTVFTSLTKEVSTNPQISYQGWVQDYPHPQNWLSVYWVCGGFSKRYGYCNLLLDQMLQEADATLNFEEAIKKYQAAEDLILQDVPAAFANYRENIYLIKPYVIGPKDNESSNDAGWIGQYGPVWQYDINLSQVPENYPKQ